MNPTNITYSDQAAAQQGFMTQVFGWMAGGLAVSGLVANYIASSVGMLSGGMMMFAFIAQIGVVIGLSSRIHKMSARMATGLFIGYSALTGVTLSVLLLIYTAESVASTFMITAGTFGVMAVWGATTKRDLTGLGSFLFMGLIGIVIASVVNMFVRSSQMHMMISYVGVLVFTGLTAYDIQQIKRINEAGFASAEDEVKASVIGALRLYLDFINLFIMLMSILGNRRS